MSSFLAELLGALPQMGPLATLALVVGAFIWLFYALGTRALSVIEKAMDKEKRK